jgi:hypothetical protein
VQNSASTEEAHGILEQLQSYVQSHDVTVSLPGDSQLTLTSRNINNGELNLSLKFDQEDSADNVTEGKHDKAQILKLGVTTP